MSYAIITDSTANLTAALLEENDILDIPLPCFVDGREYRFCELEQFNDTEYYSAIRNGAVVTTSQINPQCYMDSMRPLLDAGEDILFIGISSGISGSFASAEIAKRQLMEEYPERRIELIDSRGAGLGEGLLALMAAKCRAVGKKLEDTVEQVSALRERLYQVFIVDDLMHLKRTGRLSNAGAILGSLLNIKPLLKGSTEGKIVAFDKVRGRKKAIRAMAEKCFSLAQNAAQQIIGITHADCREDAEQLAGLIREKLVPKEILILKHEPVTGSHIGPGALALFFAGDADVRCQ